MTPLRLWTVWYDIADTKLYSVMEREGCGCASHHAEDRYHDSASIYVTEIEIAVIINLTLT